MSTAIIRSVGGRREHVIVRDDLLPRLLNLVATLQLVRAVLDERRRTHPDDEWLLGLVRRCDAVL